MHPDELVELNRCLASGLSGGLREAAALVNIKLNLGLDVGCFYPKFENPKDVFVFGQDMATIFEGMLKLFNVPGGRELSSPFGKVVLSRWLLERLRRVSFPGVGGDGCFGLPLCALEVASLKEMLSDFGGSNGQGKRAVDSLLGKLKELEQEVGEELAKFDGMTISERIEKAGSFQRQYGFSGNPLLTPDSRDDVHPELAEVECTLLAKPLKPNVRSPRDLFDVYDIDMNYYDEVLDGDAIEETLVPAGTAVVVKFPRGDYETIRVGCEFGSDDWLDAYDSCFDKNGRPLYSLREPVWLLDRFYVEPGFERLAPDFLCWVLDHVIRWTGTVVVLPVMEVRRNGELSFDRSPEATARLREFFASQGFLPLGKTSYMFLEMP